MVPNQLSSSHSVSMVGHAALRDWQSHLIPPFSLYDEEGSSFLGFVSPDVMVNSKSVVGMKLGDSSVVIGYQVQFTHTWSMEHFVAQSHGYPGIMVKVSRLSHFPLEEGCVEWSFRLIGHIPNSYAIWLWHVHHCPV